MTEGSLKSVASAECFGKVETGIRKQQFNKAKCNRIEGETEGGARILQITKYILYDGNKFKIPISSHLHMEIETHKKRLLGLNILQLILLGFGSDDI